MCSNPPTGPDQLGFLVWSLYERLPEDVDMSLKQVRTAGRGVRVYEYLKMLLSAYVGSPTYKR